MPVRVGAHAVLQHPLIAAGAVLHPALRQFDQKDYESITDGHGTNGQYGTSAIMSALHLTDE